MTIDLVVIILTLLSLVLIAVTAVTKSRRAALTLLAVSVAGTVACIFILIREFS